MGALQASLIVACALLAFAAVAPTGSATHCVVIAQHDTPAGTFYTTTCGVYQECNGVAGFQEGWPGIPDDCKI